MVSHHIIPSIQLEIALSDCQNRALWEVSSCN